MLPDVACRMHIHVPPRLSSLLFLSVTFSLSLDQFSEISTCSAQIYKVARPTPFFFQLRMQCIAWVYMNARCATIRTYIPRIVDPSTAPRHFGAEAKNRTLKFVTSKCSCSIVGRASERIQQLNSFSIFFLFVLFILLANCLIFFPAHL